MPDPRKKSDATPLQRRRSLRQRSTKPEQLMWAALRDRRLGGLKFRRQHSIGVYIVDFVCQEQNIVGEIDGEYHDYVEDKDARRQRFLESAGYKVLRFSNEDVLSDAEAVVLAVANVAGVPPPTLSLSPIVLPATRMTNCSRDWRQHDGREGTPGGERQPLA